MTAVETAILTAITRTRIERELPAAVLNAIGETHVVIERERWERVLEIARTRDGMYMVDFEMQPGDLDGTA